jgi:hypothetical protein
MAAMTSAVVGTGFLVGFACGRLVTALSLTSPSPHPPPPPPPPPHPPKRRGAQQLQSLIRDEYEQVSGVEPPKIVPVVAAAAVAAIISRADIVSKLGRLKKAPPVKTAQEKSAEYVQCPLFVEIRTRNNK